MFAQGAMPSGGFELNVPTFRPHAHLPMMGIPVCRRGPASPSFRGVHLVFGAWAIGVAATGRVTGRPALKRSSREGSEQSHLAAPLRPVQVLFVLSGWLAAAMRAIP